MNRVLIKGFYGHDNLGDEILLLALLNWCDARSLSALVSAGDRRDRAQEVARLSGADVSFGQASLLHEIAGIMRSDAFVIGGGGLFPGGRFWLPTRLLIIATVGALLGKPTVIVGVGVNPIRSLLSRFVWRQLARLCSAITVRDEASSHVLTEVLGVELAGMKVTRCADLVFTLLPTNFPPKGVGASQRKKLVFALAQPWSNAEREGDHTRHRYQSLKTNLAACLSEVSSQGWDITLVPFYYPGDLELAQEIIKECGPKTTVVIHEDQSVESRLRQISSADVVLSMRFHGLVLGGLFSKRLVAIAYDYKMDELIKELGLADSMVRLGIRSGEFYGEEMDVDFVALREKLLHTLDTAPDYSENRKRLVELSSANFQVLDLALAIPRSA